MIIKEDQRIMLTKRLLQDSLVKLLKEKSIYKITVRELCDVAGINRSTFYRYYDNQFILLGEMEQQIVSHVYKNLEKSKKRDKQDNFHLLIVILSMLEENVEFSRLLVNNSIDPTFPSKLIKSPQMLEYVTIQLTGKYDANHLEYLTHLITYGCYRMVQIWINKQQRESVKDMAITMSMFIEKLVS